MTAELLGSSQTIVRDHMETCLNNLNSAFVSLQYQKTYRVRGGQSREYPRAHTRYTYVRSQRHNSVEIHETHVAVKPLEVTSYSG